MLMRWMIIFMILLTAVAAATIIVVALVRPKRHDHASKVSGYTLIDCSYQPLSDAPTYRMHITKTHEPHAIESTVHGHIKSIQSKNWAGYVVARDLKRPAKDSVSSVSANWTVPRIWPPPPTPRSGYAGNNNNTTRYSATWVGIDGFSRTSKSVQQIGTESDWDPLSGQQINYAWFEIYEQRPMMIVNFPVSVGDSISAAVKRATKASARKNGQFELTIRNNTRGVAVVVPSQFTRSPHAECSTAQFIVEAPFDKQILPLADFGAQSFHECICTIDQLLNTINGPDRQFAPIHMVNPTNQKILQQTIAQTSPLAPDGKSFTITT
jgi:hypothetical protein